MCVAFAKPFYFTSIHRVKTVLFYKSNSESCINRLFVYDTVTISEEAKFLTFSMDTFRDNKQALYGIFSVCSHNYQSTAKQIIQTKLL